MNMYFTVYLCGEKAVKAGYTLQNGYCYKRIEDNNKFIAQLEVVRDDDEAKLVSVSFIHGMEDVEKVLQKLSDNGFVGMDYQVYSYSDEERCEDGEFVRSGKIENLPDLIVTTTFGGLHVFRHNHCSPKYHMQDQSVLEIMDANTGEIYKTTQGWNSTYLEKDIAELLRM